MSAARCRLSSGTVLVLELVMVAMMSVLAASTLFLVRGELGSAAAARRAHQARAAAMSGIHRALSVLLSPPADEKGFRDNPELFQAQKITGEDGEEWYFTVFGPGFGEPPGPRYGPADEAGKVNLNIATEEMLLRLPGMTEELVHCLLDYRDADSDAHAHGLEQAPAGTHEQTYLVKDAPLGTPEELLLVKGFTGQVVFGEDANLNSTLEPNEDDGEESFPPDDRNGELDCGLGPFVTTFSYEPDVDNEQNPRINISKTDPGELGRKLETAGFGSDTIEFIVAARHANVKFADPAQLLHMELEIDDPNQRGRKKKIRSEVDEKNLPRVMDKLTCGGVKRRGEEREVLLGRINVNIAPLAVLRALPGISDNTSRRIADVRAALDAEDAATTAWLYTQGVVSADFFKKIAPYLTARTYQFRLRSFGYSMEHGTFCLLEAVVDLGSGRPQIVYVRDLTRLGVPMPVSLVER